MEENCVKNTDYVASRPESVEWLFIVEPSVTTGGEVLTELLEITQSLLAVLDEIVTPTELTYALGTIPTGVSQADTITERGNFERHRLHSADGVAYTDLEREICSQDVPENMEPYVSTIEVTNSKAKVYLREGDVWVDTGTEDVYRMYSRGTTSGVPGEPLLSIKLYHMGKQYAGKHRNDEAIETVYWVSLGSRSDIWFGDSPVERVNRARLGKALEQVFEQFEVIDTQFETGFVEWTDEDVTSVVFDEKEDEDTLIETARKYISEL